MNNTPSIAEMTNLYLYGQATVPASLVDAALIRPDGTHIDYRVDVNQYIIYNKSDGNLYYDADGSGNKSAMIKIAVFDAAPSLAASDIFII